MRTNQSQRYSNTITQAIKKIVSAYKKPERSLWFKIAISLPVVLSSSLLSNLSYGVSNNASPQLADLVDEEFQKITTLAYREQANSASYKLSDADLNTLVSEVTRADEALNSDRAILLVAANMNTIQKNINAKELQAVTAILLKYHAAGIAEDIANVANKQGDRYAQAKQNFEFAKYSAATNHWDKALDWLKKIDSANELSKENGDEAYIIYGAALQFKKKHREALGYYARVKSDSVLYPIAQLNTALGHIRQDWWTDAQISIEQALSAAGKDDIEIVNRLYTILGFSQLQQGFYRNARETFRNVKIKSAYANRALFGVGMAALNQEDFVGALNAFNQLKSHPENDMSVAQSYLLSSFVLTKLKQNTTAASSYAEAISFYEQKANFYDSLLNEIKTNNSTTQPLLISKITADNGKDDPVLSSLAEELKILSLLSSRTLSPNTSIQINKLYGTIYTAFLSQANTSITKKQAAFNSYLNQSRFGLTRLYDAN